MEKEGKKEKSIRAVSKKRLKKDSFKLAKDVKIGGKWKQKGDIVKLTVEGYKFFKQNKYIV